MWEQHCQWREQLVQRPRGGKKGDIQNHTHEPRERKGIDLVGKAGSLCARKPRRKVRILYEVTWRGLEGSSRGNLMWGTI